MKEQQPSDAPRIPFVVLPENRFTSANIDARLVNCIAEKGPREGDYHVVSRPGVGLYSGGGVAGVGRGIYLWEGGLYHITDGTLYRNFVSVGSVQSAGFYSLNQTLGATHRLFFHNGAKAYTYTVAGGVVEVAYATTVDTTGNLNSNTIINGIPSTAGIVANAGVTGAGIPDGSYVVSVDSGVQVTINTNATITATGVALTFSNPGFPVDPVPGSAYLDGTLYVMRPNAKINGSDLNDPTSWDGLNFLTAYIEPDQGVALAKQLVQVIAFKEWSTEVFYDAGNPVGSPLARVQGAKANYGCRHARSVQDSEGVLVWIAGTRSGEATVLKMEGLKVGSISYPSIDRLVQQPANQTVHSWNVKVDGHRLYGVSLVEANLTLVFDFTTNLWYRWTDQSGNYFPFIGASLDGDGLVLLQHVDGRIFQLDGSFTTDAGQTIPVEAYLPSWDGGTTKRKTINNLYFVGDQQPGQVLYVRCNDYDYDPLKWTNFRRVDMGLKRPRLSNCGTFNRRAYHIKCTSPVRMRIRSLEVDIDLGTI
jgi:hypothetical protein